MIYLLKTLPLAVMLPIALTVAFAPQQCKVRNQDTFSSSRKTVLYAFGFGADEDNSNNDDDDNGEEEFDVEKFMEERRRKKESGDANVDEEDEGRNLSGEFFKNLRIRNIGRNTRLGRTRRRDPQVFPSDVRASGKSSDEDDDNIANVDEKENEDDETVREFTAGEMNIFKGIDEGGVGKLAGNVTITNKDLYATLKERILESPSAFQKLTTGANDEDEDYDSMESDFSDSYTHPEIVPDAELSAGEVVTTVLSALRHNDVPTVNKGVEILFGYSSPASVLMDPRRAPTVDEYADMLKSSSDSKILLDYREIIFDKADYSQDSKRAFITIRLKDAEGTWTGVNFILSLRPDDQCWLIDSHLVKARGLRRGRRW